MYEYKIPQILERLRLSKHRDNLYGEEHGCLQEEPDPEQELKFN